jgi:hypothetical protein
VSSNFRLILHRILARNWFCRCTSDKTSFSWTELLFWNFSFSFEESISVLRKIDF